MAGCKRVSPGCDHCYAIPQTHRFSGPTSKVPAFRNLTVKGPDGVLDWSGEVRLLWDRLDDPKSWRDPQLVFVNSMSDLFHDHVTDEFLDRVWNTMRETPQHTYQILTKRPGRMRTYLQERKRRGDVVLPNVWLGASVESQEQAWRIPVLLETPAAVRFLSCEPLLGPLDLQATSVGDALSECAECRDTGLEPDGASVCQACMGIGRLHWVIVGGESHRNYRKARELQIKWALDIVDQCTVAGVAVFVKQLGTAWAKRVNSRRPDGKFDSKGDVTKNWPPGLQVRLMPEALA